MNKNLVRGLVVGILLIILGVIIYGLFFKGGPTETTQTPATAPGPTAPAPVAVKPPPAPPATQEITSPKQPGAPPTPSEVSSPRQAEAPPVGPKTPSQKVTPAPESSSTAPKITVFPPEKEKEHYGFLVNRYRKYGRASKMMDKLKNRGIPSFIQQSPKAPNLSEVWAGPFSDLGKAKAAEKSLRAMLKGPRKIHKIIGTVPK
jgi:type IV secretory pathway VirB10-like protein